MNCWIRFFTLKPVVQPNVFDVHADQDTYYFGPKGEYERSLRKVWERVGKH